MSADATPASGVRPLRSRLLPGLEQAREVERLAVVADGYALECRAASRDAGAFLEVAMVEEHTQKPLVVAAHQRLLFAFVDACRYCVVRMPVGTAKSFTMSALTLHLLGQDPTVRGGIVSATETQSAKLLKAVGQYVSDPVLAPRVRSVFPRLAPSARPDDQWTQTKLVVERPPAIRDASLAAYGISTAVLGSRLSWVVCDDLLSPENTRTEEARDKLHNDFDGKIITRVDPGPHARVVVTNTPWHTDDLTYRLEGIGWATVTMSICGDLRFSGVDLSSPKMAAVRALLVPSATKEGVWRLAEHAPDPDESTTLWPERYSREHVEHLRATMLPHQFARSYLCEAVDDATARCKNEWIARCLAEGDGVELVHELPEADRLAIDPLSFVVSGVDLAAKKRSEGAETVVFTALVYGNGDMQPLWVDAGQFTAPEIRDLIVEHHRRYGSVLFVEDNGVQQWMLELVADVDAIPVFPFDTGLNKWHPSYGVESVFLLMQQGKWIIPSEGGLPASKQLARWLNNCRSFNPAQHTGDHLMASWFAKEGARVIRQNAAYFGRDDGDTGVRVYGTGA